MISSAKLLTTTGGPAMPYIKREMARLKKQIKSVKTLLPIEINNLGKRAGRLMADRVRRMTQRQGATGDLANALENCMHFKRYGMNGAQVSMQSSTLPEYWAMINYGGFVSPVSLRGFWSDNGGKSNAALAGGKGKGTFYADKRGYKMIPASPIKGFHYLMFAYTKILTELRSGKFTAKVMAGVR